MYAALLGKKIGMTQVYDNKGVTIPVTVIKAGPCTVMQVKDTKRDGYDALQIGYDDVKPHRSTMPLIMHAAAAGVGPKRMIREVRLTEPSEKQLGDVITVELFKEADVAYVDVTGVSKGRGYSGVMRKYGFGGQPGSHGTERKHRSPGSIGGGAPRGHGRAVKKGKRMSGQYGNVRVTARCQRLISVDTENGLLLVHGSVPGPNGGYVMVRQSKTKPGKKS